MAAVQLFGKQGESRRRRKHFAEQIQSATNITAVELTRTGFEVDIATQPVHIKRQGVLHGLAYITAQELGVPSRVLLTSHQFFFQPPTLFVDLAVGVLCKLCAEQIRESGQSLAVKDLTNQVRHPGIKTVVAICRILIGDGQKKERVVRVAQSSRENTTALRRSRERNHTPRSCLFGGSLLCPARSVRRAGRRHGFQVGYQYDADAAKEFPQFGRRGRHRLVQKPTQYVVLNRGGAKVAEQTVQWDCLIAALFRELFDRNLRMCRHRLSTGNLDFSSSVKNRSSAPLSRFTSAFCALQSTRRTIVEIDAAFSRQAMEAALEQFPDFAKFQPRIEWRALMKGGAFIVAYEERPPNDFPNAWDFQNAYVKGYKRLADTD